MIRFYKVVIKLKGYKDNKQPLTMNSKKQQMKSLPQILPLTQCQKKPLTQLHKVQWSVAPTCLIDGHEGYPIIYVCVNPNCTHVTRLVCELCFYRSHAKHSKQFIAIDEIKQANINKLRFWPFQQKYRSMFDFIRKHDSYVDNLIHDVKSTFDNMIESITNTLLEEQEKYLKKIKTFYAEKTVKQEYIDLLTYELQEIFQLKQIQKNVREIFNKEVRHEVFAKKMKNLFDSELIKERREKTFNDFLTNDKGKDLDFDKIYFLKKQNIIIREIKEQQKSIKENYVTVDEADAGLERIITQTIDYLNKNAIGLPDLTYELRKLDDGSEYRGFLTGGNRVLIGMREYKNGYVYYGEWKNNGRNGWGIYENRQVGYKYNGNWKEDKRNGFGKQINGDRIYEGNFLDDKKDGFGSMKQGGIRYDITWKNDKKHGTGKKIDAGGKETEVYFLNGIESGMKKKTEMKGRDITLLAKLFTKS